MDAFITLFQRELYTFLCPDLSYLCVFASKVMCSPGEITEAIHGCKVQHVLYCRCHTWSITTLKPVSGISR